MKESLGHEGNYRPWGWVGNSFQNYNPRLYLAAYSLAVVVSLKANSKGQVLPRKTAGLDKHLNAVRVHDSQKNDTRDSSSMQTQSVLFGRSQQQAGVYDYQDREGATPK